MMINQASVSGANIDPTTQQSDNVNTKQTTATNTASTDSSLKADIKPGVIVELGSVKDTPITYGKPTVQTLGNGLGQPPPNIQSLGNGLGQPPPKVQSLGNGLGQPPPSNP